MSDTVVFSPTSGPATPSRRGQSFVEFALVLPLLLVLLLGIADFGRVFHAGIVVESAARNAAEAASQEYLQLRRGGTAPSAAELDRIAAEAKAAVCEEAERLPNRVMSGGTCVMPTIAVCIHDDPAELVNYGAGCGSGAGAAPAECTELHSGWPSMWTSGVLPSVEVRVCYRFETIVNLAGVQLPFGNGLDLGTIWLQRARVFSVADY
jgi:hypothetical protein